MVANVKINIHTYLILLVIKIMIHYESPSFPSPPLLDNTSTVPTAKTALSLLQKTSKLLGLDPAPPHEPSISRGTLPNRVIIVPLKLMSMK